MQVFVLSTGRCGSFAFAKACGHFTNYTAGHETRIARLGAARLGYPDHHIESDNRLSWLLGRLDAQFGDQAFYVHLTREAEAVARSYAKRGWEGSIIQGYSKSIIMNGQKRNPDTEMIEFARDYVETVNTNIAAFLKDKSQVMAVQIETAADQFEEFATRIGANGDLNAAKAEFDRRHNASG